MQSGDNTPLANTGQVAAWQFIAGMAAQSEWVYISSHVRRAWDASMSHAGVTASREGWSDGNMPEYTTVEFTWTEKQARSYLMPEVLDCGAAEEAGWWDALSLEVCGWDAPLGGLLTRGSSSEELSSDAPRMNLRRSLASGPELSIGTLVLEGFWVVVGKDGFSELTSEDACGASASAVLTPEAPLTCRLLSSLRFEVAGAAEEECSPGWGDCVGGTSSSAGGGSQPDGDSSPFTGIATVLVLILHSSNNIHRINPKPASGSIHRHPPGTETTEHSEH